MSAGHGSAGGDRRPRRGVAPAGDGAIAAADLRTTVTINADMSAVSHPEERLLLGSGGSARLDLAATGNRNVRGQLSIAADLHLPPAAPAAAGTDPDHVVTSLGVQRAFIRARLPGFRLTAGKTRLSWGRGRFFNAGDILFGPGTWFRRQRQRVPDRYRLARCSLRPGRSAVFPGGGGAARSPARSPRRHRRRGSRRDSPWRVDRRGRLTGTAPTPTRPRHGEHRGYVSLEGALAGVDWHLSAGSAVPARGAADLGEAGAGSPVRDRGRIRVRGPRAGLGAAQPAAGGRRPSVAHLAGATGSTGGPGSIRSVPVPGNRFCPGGQLEPQPQRRDLAD